MAEDVQAPTTAVFAQVPLPSAPVPQNQCLEECLLRERLVDRCEGKEHNVSWR
jgi:hypothetical protein